MTHQEQAQAMSRMRHALIAFQAAQVAYLGAHRRLKSRPLEEVNAFWGFCQLSRQRCRRVPPEAVCLACFKDGERGCRTTEMKHATVVGGNVLVVADARAEVIAEFVVAATEALR